MQFDQLKRGNSRGLSEASGRPRGTDAETETDTDTDTDSDRPNPTSYADPWSSVLFVKHQGGACRRAHPPQTAYCRDRWMVAGVSRQRIQVSQQFSSGAPEPAPDPFPNPLGDNDTRKIRRIHKAFSAEKENSPLGSEEQDAWVNAIMEERAARSARSRRKVIEDFHCVWGW